MFGSGVGALGLPLVDRVLIQVVAAILVFFLGAAAFPFLALFAAITQFCFSCFSFSPNRLTCTAPGGGRL
jgi:hypothetical protein